jgi:hypothetical protein
MEGPSLSCLPRLAQDGVVLREAGRSPPRGVVAQQPGAAFVRRAVAALMGRSGHGPSRAGPLQVSLPAVSHPAKQ